MAVIPTKQSDSLPTFSKKKKNDMALQIGHLDLPEQKLFDFLQGQVIVASDIARVTRPSAHYVIDSIADCPLESYN